MKKLLVIGFVLIWIAAVTGALGVSASAYTAVGVDIWVDIINGGTAAVTTEVNCPLPRQSSLTLEHGENAAFHIDFDEEGVYSYIIRVVPDEREIIFDSSVYDVKIFVNERDGELFATVVIYDEDTGLKYSNPHGGQSVAVEFENITEQPTETPAETTPPVEPTNVPGGRTDPTSPTVSDSDISGQKGGYSRPQTGDDTKMERYFLLAILASAGLFILSIVYWKETNRLIRPKR